MLKAVGRTIKLCFKSGLNISELRVFREEKVNREARKNGQGIKKDQREQTLSILGRRPLYLSIYSRFPYKKPSRDQQSNARFSQGLIFIRRCWR
jgi:hypothetical protein